MKAIRRAQVEEKTGLKHSYLYDLISRGLFPRPVKLGPKARGWVEDEIDAWLSKKVNERDLGTPK